VCEVRCTLCVRWGVHCVWGEVYTVCEVRCTLCEVRCTQCVRSGVHCVRWGVHCVWGTVCTVWEVQWQCVRWGEVRWGVHCVWGTVCTVWDTVCTVCDVMCTLCVRYSVYSVRWDVYNVWGPAHVTCQLFTTWWESIHSRNWEKSELTASRTNITKIRLMVLSIWTVKQYQTTNVNCDTKQIYLEISQFGWWC